MKSVFLFFLLWLAALGVGACLDSAFLTGKECDAQGRCVRGFVCNQHNRCVEGKACLQATECEDGNDCTLDNCVAEVCQNTAVADETPCEDSDPCTVGDVCLAGSCQAGDQPKDADEDGFVDQACPGGDDCDDDPLLCGERCYPTASEGLGNASSCTDGFDNDCDGLTDAGDMECVVCSLDEQCDDQNECTDDTCVAGACTAVFNVNPCDDENACTQQDVCFAGRCRGYNTCTDECAPDCLSGGGEAGCCTQACTADPCPSCQPGDSCDQVCDANSCTQKCLPRSVCHLSSQDNDRSDLECVNAICFLECEGGQTCNLQCGGSSVCDLECDSTDSCTLDCAQDARCSLVCNDVDACVLDCANPVSCSSDVQVCGRDCPP